MTRPTGDLVFIGDVHLERKDEALEDFVAFLEGLRDSACRVVLMGDLFNLWIGDPGLERPHHVAVSSALRKLRASGIVVQYIEGNRDYRIGVRHGGSTFDAVSAEGFEERFAGHRIWAAHGDLVNPADRQYRAWRRVSRSGVVWALFRLLPSRWRAKLADSLERKFRATNLAFKQRVPDDQVRDYGERYHARGFDRVVLGHFHVERDLPVSDGAARVLVLPEWKGSRRHLRVSPDGEIGFVGPVA